MQFCQSPTWRKSILHLGINFSTFRFHGSVVYVKKKTAWRARKSFPPPLWGHCLPVTALALDDGKHNIVQFDLWIRQKSTCRVWWQQQRISHRHSQLYKHLVSENIMQGKCFLPLIGYMTTCELNNSVAQRPEKRSVWLNMCYRAFLMRMCQIWGKV